MLYTKSLEKRKGNCFQVNAEFVLFEDSSMVLCHGICLGTGGNAFNLFFAHAWTESEDGIICYDAVYQKTFAREIYYDAGNVKNVKRYNVDELRKMISKHETFGPWDKKINKAAML